MKTISAEQARANIVAAYTKQHNEAVSALSAAIDRVKAAKEVKKDATESVKPELSKLLLESSQEAE
jgi:predicted transcriptional regulator